MRRPHHLTVLLPVLLCTGLALGACSSGSSPKASASQAPSATAAQTTAAQEDDNDSSSSNVVPRTQAPTPASAPSPTPSPKAPASPAPDGYQSVTTGITNISFAVPSNWVVFTKLDEQETQQLAEIMDAEVSEISSSTALTDLMTISPYPDNLGFLEGVECTSLALPLPEDSMKEQIESYATDNGYTLEYSTTTDSPNGTIYYGVASATDNNFHVGVVFLPTTNQTYVYTKVYTSSTARVEELLGVIASTLS